MCWTWKRRIKPGAPERELDMPIRATQFVYHGKYDHQKLRYGDVDRALAEADHVVEGRYQMSPDRAGPDRDLRRHRGTRNRTGATSATPARRRCSSRSGTASKVLNMPSSRLHFIGGTVGRRVRRQGRFSVHEPLAILGTMLTGRPVK
jgi:CO/xanthine dehydrogenase Mo-binding subunit